MRVICSVRLKIKLIKIVYFVIIQYIFIIIKIMVRQKTIFAVTLAEYLFNNKNNCNVSTCKKISEIKEEKKNRISKRFKN